MCSDRVGWAMQTTVLVALGLFVVGGPRVAAQEITSEQRTQIARVKLLVDKAGKDFNAGDNEAAAGKIREAQRELIRLAKTHNAEILGLLKNDHARIVKAQELLKKHDFTFTALPSLDSFSKSKSSDTDADVDDKPTEPSGENPFESDSQVNKTDAVEDDSDEAESDEAESEFDDAEPVSFTKEIVPIIVEHCGQCHIDDNKGRYSAANYNSLKKGTRKGVAVKPRDIEKSRMVQLIEGGEMPPEMPDFPPEKLEKIKTWIAQGAKFDGKSKTEKISTGRSSDSNNSSALK
jgi:mono/diheme cytochrome c family protein